MVIFRHFLVYLGDELKPGMLGNGTGAESESFVLQFWKNLEFEGQTQYISYLYLILFGFVSIRPPTSLGKNPLPPSLS